MIKDVLRMKRCASIKTRITIWYTAIMFVIIVAVITAVGILSYQMSIDVIEKEVILRVTQVSEKISKHQYDVMQSVDDGEYKNVSIYKPNGEYIAGQYIYDITNLKFVPNAVRREKVDGGEYIIYDIMNPAPPGSGKGFWIRGAESVNSSNLLGRSAVIVMLFAIPLILAVAALGGYYITRRAFLPINNIVKTANSICMQSDVKQRILIDAEAHKDELYELSVTLNRMLNKIETLISQEKQFTSDASHELRTPISVILAQSEYLLEIAGSEKEKELAQNIVDKSKQISKLVSRLLMLARMDSNRQKINKEKVDLRVIADVAVESMQDFAKSRDIMLYSSIDKTIMVEADEALLLSALTNLIGNGIKYGKESGYVKVSACQSDEDVQISVEDNGIGISEDNLEKIWGRFWRADDVRNDENVSYGLGLAMVKSIAALHNGEISVKSQPGYGSEFVLTLKNNV